MNLPSIGAALQPPTVASLLQGCGFLALDHQLAAPLLALPVPGALCQRQAPVAGVPGGTGERGYPVLKGVAVLSLRGVLTPNHEEAASWYGWTTYQGLARLCAEVAAAEDVQAVVLEVDSPGGMVVGIEAASEALRGLAAAKPVHALVSPVAASAAYWIASQATDVTVTPGGIVGSIGVGLTTYSYTAPSMIFGAQFYDLTSTHARAKWPDAATEEGRAELMRMLDECEARFHAVVAAGRAIPLDQLTARLSVTDDPRDGGAVFTGPDGVARGLADRVEARQAFYDRLFATYGSPAPRGRARALVSPGAAALAKAAAARAQAAT